MNKTEDLISEIATMTVEQLHGKLSEETLETPELLKIFKVLKDANVDLLIPSNPSSAQDDVPQVRLYDETG